MDEIRNLKIEFDDLLKQAQEDLDAIVGCAIKDEPCEYTAFKAAITVKNMFALEYFYISTARKFIELSIILHELKGQNVERAKIDQAQNMVYHYNNFKNYVKKEIAAYSHDANCKLRIGFFYSTI